MSLTTRLTTFAMAGLAAVLAGFSITLFTLSWVYLHRQADERAAAAVDALVAAIEIHPQDVEWEPDERKIFLGAGHALENVRWTIHDGSGRLVDCSPNLEAGDAPVPTNGPWSFFVQVVRAGQFTPESVDVGEPAALTDVAKSLRVEDVGARTLPESRFAHDKAFTLTVAVSRRPVIAALWRVGGVLVGVALAIWLIAALVGRYVCRRALRPVAVMAASAREAGHDPAARLTVPPTGDELDELGRSFNDLLARLHTAFERQRRFTGDAAHQLRTPIAAVLGQVEVTLRHERSPEEYRRVLGIVDRRVGQLRQIVESLLFLARAESSRRFDLELLDLADWLRERSTDWTDHPRARDIVFDVPTNVSYPVRGHAGLLGQVIENLIDNACKYSEAGSTVRVRLHHEVHTVSLIVEDLGIGIAAEELPMLGHPFVRGREPQARGIAGVGLGLAVVRRVAAVLGGEMRVHSAPGKGSRFQLDLPLNEFDRPLSGDGADRRGSHPSLQPIGA